MASSDTASFSPAPQWSPYDFFSPPEHRGSNQPTRSSLPKAIFLAYLDRILGKLGLSMGLRGAFTTLWLPHFEAIDAQGLDIAFRFASQDQLADWATLEIDADCVTRVCLIFKGVDTSPSPDGNTPWVRWQVREEGLLALDWAERIGINARETADEGLFRGDRARRLALYRSC